MSSWLGLLELVPPHAIVVSVGFCPLQQLLPFPFCGNIPSDSVSCDTEALAVPTMLTGIHGLEIKPSAQHHQVRPLWDSGHSG